MEIINNPDTSTWDVLTERNIPDDAAISESVERIVRDVRNEGDAAVRRYALQFDGAALTRLELTSEERAAAAEGVRPEVKAAIMQAAKTSRHSIVPSCPRR